MKTKKKNNNDIRTYVAIVDNEKRRYCSRSPEVLRTLVVYRCKPFDRITMSTKSITEKSYFKNLTKSNTQTGLGYDAESYELFPLFIEEPRDVETGYAGKFYEKAGWMFALSKLIRAKNLTKPQLGSALHLDSSQINDLYECAAEKFTPEQLKHFCITLDQEK